MRNTTLVVFGMLLTVAGCDEGSGHPDGGRDAGGARVDGGPVADGDGGPTADGGATALDGGSAADDGGAASDAGLAPEWVFEEVDGLVAFEAEHFTANDDQGRPRAWYLTAEGTIPDVTPDPDPPHHESASGGAYLEGLPDTRVTHDDPLVNGESFYNNGGEGPLLTYRVVFNTTGRYYVHGRAYSTGGEDNGIHVGIDGTWPDSGRRLQWCSGKNQWTWSSAQRDSGGTACGVEHTIWIDVETAGEHTIQFSMREDGHETDKMILTTDASYVPEGAGPAERTYTP